MLKYTILAFGLLLAACGPSTLKPCDPVIVDGRVVLTGGCPKEHSDKIFVETPKPTPVDPVDPIDPVDPPVDPVKPVDPPKDPVKPVDPPKNPPKDCKSNSCDDNGHGNDPGKVDPSNPGNGPKNPDPKPCSNKKDGGC